MDLFSLSKLVEIYKEKNFQNGYITIYLYNEEQDIELIINKFEIVNGVILKKYKVFDVLFIKLYKKYDLIEFQELIKVLNCLKIIKIYQCNMEVSLLDDVFAGNIDFIEFFRKIGLTQRKIMIKTGLSSSKVNDYFKGRRKINLELIRKLHNAYPLLPIFELFAFN